MRSAMARIWPSMASMLFIATPRRRAARPWPRGSSRARTDGANFALESRERSRLYLLHREDDLRDWGCLPGRPFAFGGREHPHLVLTFSNSPFHSMPERKGKLSDVSLKSLGFKKT